MLIWLKERVVFINKKLLIILSLIILVSISGISSASTTTNPILFGNQMKPILSTVVGGTSAHSSLSNLLWSAAGHIMNSDLDMNSNSITEIDDANMTRLNAFGTDNSTFGGDVRILGTLYGGSPVKIAGVNISNNRFYQMENKNKSLNFVLENINDSSNATTVISAKNDVGGSMSIGIGSSSFMVGQTLYNNVTVLFSRAKGVMAFANFYNQPFKWLYNPSDDNDPENLVIAMTLNGTELNVTGNVTARNLFIPQYIFPHTAITQNLKSANLWANISFDEEETAIKTGINHSHSDWTNTTFTIDVDGVYDISFNIDIIDTSVGSSDIDVAGRVVYVNGTEISGSVFETDITKKNIEVELSHEFLAELNKGDQVILQFVAENVNVEASTHGTYGDHPDAASLVIKKMSNRDD